MNRKERAEADQVREIGRRARQPHLQSPVVDRPQADGAVESFARLGPELPNRRGPLRWIGRRRGDVGLGLLVSPMEERLGAVDDEEESGVIGHGFGQDRPSPGIDVVVGGDRIAVGPSRVGAQREGVGQPVLADQRKRGAGGQNREVVVVPLQQALGEGVGDAQVLQVTHPLRVEREVVAAVDEDEVGARAGVVGGKRHRQRRDEQGERGQQPHDVRSLSPGGRESRVNSRGTAGG
jgi:hypothetical protein